MMSQASSTSRQSASISARSSSLTFPANLRLALAMILPIAILLLVLIAMDSAWLHPASAAGTVRYVATTGVDTGNCTSSAAPCRTAHYAVGVAQSGDEVRVAQGTYTDVHSVGALTQVVYISRSLVLRGGYSTADWINNYITRPTVLDARTLGRTIYITNNVTATVEGFSLTGGLAASGLIDSFHLVELALHIEERFHVRIDDTELNADTFDTLAQLATLVGQRQS